MSHDAQSFTHEIRDFRQILFLPLIRPEAPDSNDLRAEPIWRKTEARALTRARGFDGKPCWVEINDHMRHLTPDGADVDRWAYQEFVYFHEFIQSVLFDDGQGWTKQDSPRPLRMFKRVDIVGMKVTIPIEEELFGASEMVVPLIVERLNLYLFSQGVAILCVEVIADPLWAPDSLPPTLAHVQALQNALRRLYPPYVKPSVKSDSLEAPEFPKRIMLTGADGVVIADCVMTPEDFLRPFVDSCRSRDGTKHASNRHNPVATPWAELLHPLRVATTGESIRNAWRQVVDERMPTMTFMNCASAGRIKDADWLRLVYLDTPGKGFAYDEGFEPEWEKKYAYDRHWNKTGNDAKRAQMPYGTRYLISAYSFVIVGTPHKELFPEAIGQHFRRMYADMMLLNHFQFAALLALSSWISNAVEEHGGADERQNLRVEMRTMRGLFLEFMERFWFTNVSNQIQARELYDRIRERIGTERIYEEVSKQLADANEYLEAEEQGEQTEAGMRLNVIAAIGVGASVPLSALALVDSASEVPKKLGFGKFKYPEGLFFDFGFVLVVVAIGYAALWALLRFASPGQRASEARTRGLRTLLGNLAQWFFAAGLFALLVAAAKVPGA